MRICERWTEQLVKLLSVSASITAGLFTAPGVSGTWRGVQNFMHWNSNSFASDQTADQGTYFARSFFIPATGCRPNVVYAATSWPQSSFPYLDSDLEKNGIVPGTQTWTFNGSVPDAPYVDKITNPVTNPVGTGLRIYFFETSWDETSVSLERKTGTNGTWLTIATWGALNTGNDVGYWSWVNTALSRSTHIAIVCVQQTRLAAPSIQMRNAGRRCRTVT